MIILYAAIVVIILAVFTGWWFSRNETFDKGVAIVFSTFFSLMFYGFVIGIGLTIVESVTEQPETYRVDLTSIGAGSATEGHIGFLGGGQIDTRGVFWYYRTDDGAATLHYRYANNTKIYQDETDSPYMLCVENEPAGLFKDLNDHTFSGEAKCEFHIPPNSVIQNYKLTTP